MKLLDICYYSGSSIVLSVTRHLDFSIFWAVICYFG